MAAEEELAKLTPKADEEGTNNQPVAPAVPEPPPEPEPQKLHAEEKEKMIVDFREKWCKQIMETALQIPIKPLGTQSLVDLFATNSFMTHRAQDGGNCVFVIDAGLDSDAAAFDRQAPFSTPPKLDPTATKNFIEAFEKIPPLSTDMI